MFLDAKVLFPDPLRLSILGFKPLRHLLHDGHTRETEIVGGDAFILQVFVGDAGWWAPVNPIRSAKKAKLCSVTYTIRPIETIAPNSKIYHPRN